MRLDSARVLLRLVRRSLPINVVRVELRFALAWHCIVVDGELAATTVEVAQRKHV
jgi:hypothetical protein